jgi:hypothetical protein
MYLPGKHLDAHVRQDGRKRISDVEKARTL